MADPTDRGRPSTLVLRDSCLPDIRDDDPFDDVVCKLSAYFVQAVRAPLSFEQLRTIPHSRSLDPLIDHLTNEVMHQALLAALLALKGHFAVLETDDDREVNEARGYACEIVAWRFVMGLREGEKIDHLLYELPPASLPPPEQEPEEPEEPDEEIGEGPTNLEASQASTERSELLSNDQFMSSSLRFGTNHTAATETIVAENRVFATTFERLNALEIAAVSEAKKFLSQRVIQKVINDIWKGEIVFWETLNVSSMKQAKKYNRRRTDPYCRLRVPRYLKVFEVLFFAAFLVLYYAVLVLRDYHQITAPEVLLYIFIAGFAYDEFGEYLDAGQAFYATDFWTLWDIGIVAIGTAFLVSRIVGLLKDSDAIIDTSFDILSLEALFLIPRSCSLLSLNSYFGTLIPCLKEMTKDFLKFLSLVIILYLGFLTTFTLLARDQFTLREMSWVLVKVFFGSSYLGFDVAQKISPLLGPPLMLIFVCMTNILLITSLISLLSNSLTKVGMPVAC
ncbi:hypothetical protein BDY21DRAFT_339188 [Lineolata rhizophorae]|uniref:Calcium channel YVC1-like C-terminal transmembrane domain-containing protein n=1 Tax=Lineolata rhizophorae TaxID=578093 RepID=A0A6A6P516_9PEZI|nr:hypothetical protein BDY21DRAFT_339188 [Lineolata rhizophorae]